MIEVVRFTLRIVATFILVPWLGLFWLEFILFLFLLSQVMNFITNHPTDFRGCLTEANDLFMEPLDYIWQHKEKS